MGLSDRRATRRPRAPTFGGSAAAAGDLRRWIDEACKRGCDLVGSVGLLVMAVPVMLAVAAAIKATSPGPVLFKQQRLGRGGVRFQCYKFRTMDVDAEDQLKAGDDLRARFQANYKIAGDPRITPLGCFLRRTSLDELPQLWNVLRGEMSLIGPRPIVPPELSKYGEHADRLLRVKPGLGGLWQVCGRSGTTYTERVSLDIRYVETRTFWMDLWLIVLTVVVVLRTRGAC